MKLIKLFIFVILLFFIVGCQKLHNLHNFLHIVDDVYHERVDKVDK